MANDSMEDMRQIHLIRFGRGSDKADVSKDIKDTHMELSMGQHNTDEMIYYHELKNSFHNQRNIIYFKGENDTEINFENMRESIKSPPVIVKDYFMSKVSSKVQENSLFSFGNIDKSNKGGISPMVDHDYYHNFEERYNQGNPNNQSLDFIKYVLKFSIKIVSRQITDPELVIMQNR